MKFLDVFAGCGGSRLGFERAGHECIGSIEYGKWQRIVYEKNFGEEPQWKDLRTVDPRSIPAFDFLTAGLPCQPFSQANQSGVRGFAREDAQLFFDVLRIIEVCRPKYVIFENTAGILKNQEGRSFATWLLHLREVGYDAEWAYFDGPSFGMYCSHQHIFLVAWDRKTIRPSVVLPEWKDFDVLPFTTYAKEWKIVSRVTTKQRAGFDHSALVLDEHGFRNLLPEEIELMLGLPEGWTDGAPKTKRHEMLGNIWPPMMAEFLGRFVLPNGKL